MLFLQLPKRELLCAAVLALHLPAPLYLTASQNKREERALGSITIASAVKKGKRRQKELSLAKHLCVPKKTLRQAPTTNLIDHFCAPVGPEERQRGGTRTAFSGTYVLQMTSAQQPTSSFSCLLQKKLMDNFWDGELIGAAASEQGNTRVVIVFKNVSAWKKN